MARGDGTGPNGQGPMTGRGAGFCAGYDVPGYANAVPGRGFGGGFRRGFGGGGRGWRNRVFAAPPVYAQPVAQSQQMPEQAQSSSEESNLGEMILQKIDGMKNELDSIKGRLDNMESQEKSSKG